MHTDDGKCAGCGRKLSRWHTYTPPEFVTPVQNGPTFCNDGCFFRFIEVFPSELERREPADYGDEPMRFVNGKTYEYADREQYLEYFEHDENERIAALKKECADRYGSRAGWWDTQRYWIALERKEQEWEKQETARLKQKAIEDEKALLRFEEEARKAEEAARLAEEMKAKPVQMYYDARPEGVVITGGSGTGKTHLLQEHQLGDLDRDNPPGMLVIDPKGLMVQRLAKLSVFDPFDGDLHDRLVIVDATKEPYPALNLFADTSRNEKERNLLLSQAIKTFRYIFSAGGFKFTPKQANCFGYCAAMMFAIGGKFSDLQNLLREGGEKDPRVQRAIPRLPKEIRPFFERDFGGPAYKQTRDEIMTRLNELTLSPWFNSLFDQSERKIDLFRCMQERKIVLVNTGIADKTISQMTGRLFISMFINAVYQRSTLPKKYWPRFHLYVDEFQEYMDPEKTPEMLRLVREYNVACHIAFHNYFGEELNDAIRSAISQNTRIKYAARPQGMERAYVARDFQCERNQEIFERYPKTNTHAQFICYASGLTPATAVQVPWLNVEKRPQMSDLRADILYDLKIEELAPTEPDDVDDEVEYDDGAVPWPEEAEIAYRQSHSPQIIDDDPDYFPRS
jgi:hypothetical protein